MARPEPDQIVDRDAEAEVFSGMLTENSLTRILVVNDKPGRGKTDLLRKLRYHCEWRCSPAIPVALFDFNGRGVTQVIDIVETLAEQLIDSTVPVQLPRFEALSRARALESSLEFQAALGSVQGSINLANASISGDAQAAGTIANINVDGPGNFYWGSEWSERTERFARKQCADIFFDDLLDVAGQSRVVLLFDTVNLADRDIRRWLLSVFIARRLLPDWTSHKLVAVIAGTDVDELLRPLGASHRACLEPAPALMGWEIGHVRDFLMLHGCGGLDDADIEFIQGKIAEGQSLTRAIQIAQLLAEID